jgi:hypothetical protein
MWVALALTLVAQAGSMQFRGRLTTADGGGRGEITLDAITIEVEARRLFSTRSLTVRLDDARSVAIQAGLFHTRVQMGMKDESTVTLRTQRKLYRELKALLKTRIT